MRIRRGPVIRLQFDSRRPVIKDTDHRSTKARVTFSLAVVRNDSQRSGYCRDGVEETEERQHPSVFGCCPTALEGRSYCFGFCTVGLLTLLVKRSRQLGG
jgi:hypothetical protein